VPPCAAQPWLGGYDFFRTHEGYGVYSVLGDQRDQIRAIVSAFTTGEVWSIDTYWLEAYKVDNERLTIPNEEGSFRGALVGYGKFLQSLDVNPPFVWTAGMENLEGRFLYPSAPPGRMRIHTGPVGKGVTDVVSDSGLYFLGDSPAQTLKPFFAKLYNSCGVRRENWQDET
jgi:hypothetical protein